MTTEFAGKRRKKMRCTSRNDSAPLLFFLLCAGWVEAVLCCVVKRIGDLVQWSFDDITLRTFSQGALPITKVPKVIRYLEARAKVTYALCFLLQLTRIGPRLRYRTKLHPSNPAIQVR